MANHEHNNLPHILLIGTAKAERYVNPQKGGGPFSVPQRNRREHGGKLLAQLDRVSFQVRGISEERKELRATGIDAVDGILLQFESEPDHELSLKSLEDQRSGIELLAVKQVDKKTLATVFVPEGKFSRFTKLIAEYLEKDIKSGKPKNQKLIESISDIRKAMIDALWTDERNLPDREESIWWEVWLRVGRDRTAYLNIFKHYAHALGLTVGNEETRFPDRTVVIAHGTKSQMSKSVELLNCIAELREAKETADFFTSLPRSEQFEWIRDALARLNPPDRNCPAVCILDTGVNNEHPLLNLALPMEDMYSYDPNWGVDDHKGHGTEMAGLALYGDITNLLISSDSIALSHKLESVKILPREGENPSHLYGYITAESIARAEVTAPNRQRVICMAVAAKDFRDRGQPSEWSAKLDALSSSADDEQRRLIVVCAGNTEREQRHRYPDSNQTDGIHDPGQSWNALTVGAFTEKTDINPPDHYPDWKPLAASGDLSPSSSTSLIWQRPWPIKPDIVLEGGNMATNPDTGTAEYVDSLLLLSTNRQFALGSPLTVTSDTSAATALAARMAAIIQAEYPDFWPETIRALLVHSAEWTDAMKERFSPLDSKGKIESLLRFCGFGVPNLATALWSAKNSLTLIAQDSLQPFDKEGNEIKSREMNLHSLPWPVEVLEELGETPVEMRVTLSYFIEPNPARRGWTRKHSYASHGLRLDVNTPEETVGDFRRRINLAARDEEVSGTTSSDAKKWLLGPKLRTLGSLHSDRWNGTAADLAQRGYIAVYPVIGWWRERHQLERWGKRARYSLVVTIKAPETDVDIYTTVANLIKPQVEIEIPHRAGE